MTLPTISSISMAKVAFILVGLPGSGKSTWSAKHFPMPPYVHCSSDAIIEEIASIQGRTYDEVFPEAIKGASQTFTARVQNAARAGMTIVIDRTNVTPKTRAQNVRLVKDIDPSYKIVALVFGVGLDAEEHARRLASRPGKTIPKHVLEDMTERFTVPTDEEGFDDVIIIDGELRTDHPDFWRIFNMSNVKGSQMDIDDATVLANRKKVVEYLQNPNRRKATDVLQSDYRSNHRCCLGHMCHAIGLKPILSGGSFRFGEEENDSTSPRELIDAVGFEDDSGTPIGNFDAEFDASKWTQDSKMVAVIKRYHDWNSLVSLNDSSRTSPQSIGKMLEAMIMGGEGTPWRAIQV